MQELAILLSSIAGAASAVAVRKFPRNATKLQSIGAGAHIKNQQSSLKIEKDILNKTIARLYEDDSGLSKIQRDRLLLKYQHQLGIILARLEKLEAAGKHPDLGPVGDGLITLMDQKLSQLDSRLYELSSKIAVSNRQAAEEKKAAVGDAEKPSPVKKMQEALKFGEGGKTHAIEIPKMRRPMEITTLTTIPKSAPKYPFEEKPQAGQIIEPQEIQAKPKAAGQKEKILQAGAGMSKPEHRLPEPRALPELGQEDASKTAGGAEDDEDDLEKIKGDILKTLSKLEQAEVE